MEFNAEDRIDKEMDMDEEYDMIPMPMYMQGGVPGMMPLQMTPIMPDFTSPMSPQMPEMIPGMMPSTLPNMMPNPNMMDVEQMISDNMAGMNMMETEDDEDIDENMTRKKKHDTKDVNKILMKIERYNPGIFRYLRMYGVPYPVAKKIIRKIIRVTLIYYED